VSTPEVGIGVAGYGMMGRAHSYAYTVAPVMRALPVRPRLRVISGRDRDKVAHAAGAYGFESWVTDWRELVSRPDVDIVDICTPPGTHAEIAAAAAAAGKAIICEKPLAVSYRQAAGASEAVRSAGVLNAMGFNYRRLPAVSLMKRMVDEGSVGKVRLWRATWLSDEFADPAIPFDWRFDKPMGGSTIADLGSHLIDMALWMVGDVAEVCGQSHTFVTERTNPRAPGSVPVTVDEASSALVRFESGAGGVLEMARTAVRRPCDFTIEVNGETGTLVFEYARLNELLYGEGADKPALYGMRRIRAEHETHPYAHDWWPIGQGVGYGASFVNHLGDLLDRWPAGPWEPDFAQGAAVQAVCEAIERAAVERRWVEVAEVRGGAVGPGAPS
jgi:predicted dehydrogenase